MLLVGTGGTSTTARRRIPYAVFVIHIHYTRRKRKCQFYRAVQGVQSAARACVDKYALRNSEGDPAAYER